MAVVNNTSNDGGGDRNSLCLMRMGWDPFQPFEPQSLLVMGWWLHQQLALWGTVSLARGVLSLARGVVFCLCFSFHFFSVVMFPQGN